MATTQLESQPRLPSGVEAIRMEHLSKRFASDVLAVDDFSLRVDHGMVLGLLGPNGAGKTTVLRMIVGLIHPTAGETYLFGERMHPGSQLLRRVGALIESPGFVPHLTGIDNLKQYWLSGGDPWSAANIDEALSIAGLGNAIHRKVRTYSKGMMQRLAIAQVLLNKPELLILDEPTVGLDPGEMRDIRDLIRQLASAGATIFLSSHILAELEQVCTHAAVMAKGHLIAAGSIDELVGASESVYLETDDIPRTLALLEKVLGVADLREEPPGLAMRLDGPARKEIVAQLVAAGIGVETISSRHRLEDAFIGMVEDGS
jgi:ABC-2 type transport system ATP-binding protein